MTSTALENDALAAQDSLVTDGGLTDGALQGADGAPVTWVRPYYSSLNGLRALAVLAVTLHHTPVGPFAAVQRGIGWMGVDLFFVLSGFLITGILFDSLGRPVYFRTFYVRRALRIFPIYYAAFAVLIVATPLLKLRYTGWVFSYLVYGGNFVVPWMNLARANPTEVLMQLKGHWTAVCDLGPLWSLCVEEQFYLLWPAVVWLVRDRQKLMRLCATVFVLTPVLRTVLYLTLPGHAIGQFFLLWSPMTRCDTLLAGAWVALWLRGSSPSRARLRRLGWGLVIVCGLLIAPGTVQLIRGAQRLGASRAFWRATAHPATNPLNATVGLSLLALACCGVLLLALEDDSWLGRVLRWRPLFALGAMSYGVYFYAGWLGGDGAALGTAFPRIAGHTAAVHLVLTLCVAAASYRFFERPILRLKERLAAATWRTPRRDPEAAPGMAYARQASFRS